MTDPDVRQRCASYAATLWRALVDRADDPGGLLAELAPVLSLARDRGTLAEVQVVGDPGAPPREVTSATVAAVDGVLRALPPHPVTLTVLADEEPATVRAAITAVAAGQDWISPRLAYILATDDAPDRPGRSPQEERAAPVRHRNADEVGGAANGPERGDGQAVRGPGTREVRPCRAGRADED